MNIEDFESRIEQLESDSIQYKNEIKAIQIKNINQDSLIKILSIAAPIIIAVLSLLGFNLYSTLKDTLTLQYKSTIETQRNELKNLVKNFGPRELGMSVASAEVHYALIDYLNNFNQNKAISTRIKLVEKINSICDPKTKMSFDDIQETITNNQGALLGVLPIIIHDLITHKEFMEKGHIVLWVIYKVISNTTGSINNKFVELLKREKKVGVNQKSNLGLAIINTINNTKSDERKEQLRRPIIKLMSIEELSFLKEELLQIEWLISSS